MSEPFILYKHPNKIDQLRRERKITIKVLAQRAGVGESTLYNMKNEKWGDSIKAEIAERIAAALGETPEKVFPDYARAKKEYEEKQAREKEHIFKSREERDEAIEKVKYLAVYIAKKNAWRMEQFKNNVMDMEDFVAEAMLTLVETAARVETDGIKKGMEFSQYAGWAIEYRFKSMHDSQKKQKRAAGFTVSLDATVPGGTESTYLDFAESILPKRETPEEIVILREECREAVRYLPPERRREPEIAALLQQIAI